MIPGTGAWTRSCLGEKEVAVVLLTEARAKREASPGAQEMASEALTGRQVLAASLTGTSLETRTPTGSVQGQ